VLTVHQWKNELIAKTTVVPEEIGEFTGLTKTIRPITITTYQMLTFRRSKEEPFANLDIFTEHNSTVISFPNVSHLTSQQKTP